MGEPVDRIHAGCDMRKDLIGGVVLLVIAGAYYAAMGSIANSTLSDEVGATGLPRMLALLLGFLGLVLIGRTLVAHRRVAVAASPENGEEENASTWRALGLLLFGAAYVAILPVLGYVLSIALLVGGVALYEGAARSWKIPVIALAGATFYWAIFVKLLSVNQPAGILFGKLF